MDLSLTVDRRMIDQLLVSSLVDIALPPGAQVEQVAACSFHRVDENGEAIFSSHRIAALMPRPVKHYPDSAAFYWYQRPDTQIIYYAGFQLQYFGPRLQSLPPYTLEQNIGVVLSDKGRPFVGRNVFVMGRSKSEYHQRRTASPGDLGFMAVMLTEFNVNR